VLLQFTLAAALFIGTSYIVRLVNKSATIGWGDLKFLAACSLWVGVDGSVLVLVLACVFTLLLALAAAPWRGLDMRQMRPFGPMLALGMVVVVAAVFLRGGTTQVP
jgi:leader peptidase (prepilin peptidase)/N-methyltransferase